MLANPIATFFRWMNKPTQPWERVHCDCISYTNRAIRCALDEGYDAGWIEHTLPKKDARHLCMKVVVDGKELIWDAPFHKYRKRENLGIIHREGIGLYIGIFYTDEWLKGRE